MDWKTKYFNWKNSSEISGPLQEALANLDDVSAYDAFFKYLEFGTGGMRGKIGAGTNRINTVMVRRLTEALAIHLIETGHAERGVAISYDNRFLSKQFAQEAAKVLSHHQIKVYLSDAVRPTPIVSLMVRDYHLGAGIMITASHNSAEYNGYKIYNDSGGQITEPYADKLNAILSTLNNEETLAYSNTLKADLIHLVDSSIDELYLSKIETIQFDSQFIKEHQDSFNIVYSPLHGAGKMLVKKTLNQIGFEKVHIVEHQADYDSNFSTVAYPNPEDPAVFKEAIQLGNRYNADLLIVTDPDADRVGISVLHKGEYKLLSGNEVGVLLLEYLARKHAESDKSYYALKTIVTSDLSKLIAAHYGIKIEETLTGFKYIGESITKKEQTDEKFLLGFEESYGYLLAPFVRDKDAIQSAAMIAEMTLFYKQQNSSLIDQLKTLYETYGYFKDELITIQYESSAAMDQLNQMLLYLRNNLPHKIGDYAITTIEDYSTSLIQNLASKEKRELTLPRSNVLKLYFDEFSWLVIRPSGTEPKCKIYFSVHEQDEKSVIEKLNNIKQGFLKLIDNFNKLDE